MNVLAADDKDHNRKSDMITTREGKNSVDSNSVEPPPLPSGSITSTSIYQPTICQCYVCRSRVANELLLFL